LSATGTSATVPTTVTVLAGATTATFTVSSTVVLTQTTSTITATLNGQSATATLTLTASPGITSVSLSPPSVVGGALSTGTVTISGNAPFTYPVYLTSDNANATVPASVNIPAGSNSATFTITTVAVGANVTANISASAYGATAKAPLAITAPVLNNLAFIPTSVTGGTPSVGTVTLSSAAPTGGLVVALSSNNTAVGTVPATVTVLAGATTATFNLTTVPIQTNATVTVSAVVNGVTLTAPVTVNAPNVLSLTFAPANVVGGNPTTATLTLNGPAPTGGYVVSITSGDAHATPPATVTVPAGQTVVMFQIPTKAVTLRTVVNITATVNGTSVTSAFAITVG
jgi:hypothetical protein